MPLEIHSRIKHDPTQPSFKLRTARTIDDIILFNSRSFWIRTPFFEPEIRNDIVIQFSGTETGRNVHFLYDIEFLDEAGIYATRTINVDLTRQCYSTLSLNVMLQVKKRSFPISPRDLLPFQDIPGHSI